MIVTGERAVIFPLIAACLPPSSIDKLFHGWKKVWAGRNLKKKRRWSGGGAGANGADDYG